MTETDTDIYTERQTADMPHRTHKARLHSALADGLPARLKELSDIFEQGVNLRRSRCSIRLLVHLHRHRAPCCNAVHVRAVRVLLAACSDPRLVKNR